MSSRLAPMRQTARPSSIEIASALGQPEPTAEQQAVIEAPLQPLLVVAGAGSGKTETMAARVVWLVAGGQVRPDEVLGLTFTRKAAGELADRVRRRLRLLRSTGLWAGSTDGEPDDNAGEVSISTYHAYAGRIVREHGLRLGVEPESRLLSEAAGWQLASEVVERWGGEMNSVDSAVSTVTAAVLDLAGECAEHLVEVDQVDQWLALRIDQLLSLPYGGAKPGGLRAPVRKLVKQLQAQRQVLPIVSAYQRVKRERDSLDFGDQVALAARLAGAVPQLVTGERSRAKVVLLDEYQDTSHAQLVMLHALFGDGHGVTAVGDPHQSIYGWRGASAGTLLRFANRFLGVDGLPAPTLPLSTSWRNDHAVLAAANAVAEPLRARSSVQVRQLRARPGAEVGRVAVRSYDTIEDEAQGIAEHIAALWWDGGRRTKVTAAVLCRKRSQFEAVQAALVAAGLPVEVVGLGGLLTTPAVTDVLAALHVVHDPSRGDRLMRLLTGAGLRLGPRDLVALGSWSRELHRRRTRRSAQVDDGPHLEVVVLADVVDESSLVEALDELPPAGWVDADGRALSAPARQRLQRLSGTLRGLRARTALALPDLVVETERALLLDIEVASRPGIGPAQARIHLDALAQVASDFAASADRATLGAFLAWLDAAQVRERGLDPGQSEVDADAVQLMTVHAAKGLEWDVVAVPGLVEGTFPAHSTRARHDGTGWAIGPVKDPGWVGDLGALPHALRGDADGLPDLRWSALAEQPDVERELDDFKARGGDHEQAEERRLAYVALTRARHSLLLTTHVWADGSTPRLPSRFVIELAQATELDSGSAVAMPEPGELNPRTATAHPVAWPGDPLEGRRAAVEAGVVLVRGAIEQRSGTLFDLPEPSGPASPAFTSSDLTVTDRAERWQWEVDVLLAERDRGRERTITASLPTHLSASRLVQLAADPESLALAVRRPMPREPLPSARRGTAFHAWVERRLGVTAMVDVMDLPGAADEQPAPDADLTLLQRNFLASEWVGRAVIAVEAAIETPIDGTVVRGRVDAVLARADGGVDVVDWKTGRPPTGRAATARAVQLAAYRLAWSRLHGLPLAQVGAAFFYASTGQTVRPVDLLDEAGLVALLRGIDSVG